MKDGLRAVDRLATDFAKAHGAPIGQAARQRFRCAVGEHALGFVVVDVDDRETRRGQRPEQDGLGIRIGLGCLVVVQVVARKVREDPDVESEPRRAVLVQGVARDLQDRRPAIVRRHGRQAGRDLQRRRRGQDRRVHGGAVIDADRSNQPAPEAGGDQNVVDHVADRGLAVGAGDADQA